jgi:hypothetical protein
MSGHYDDLTPAQVDAARTVLAVLAATEETEADVLALLRDVVDEAPAQPLEGFAIIVDALLQMIEGELGLEPREVLDRLAHFLAT